MKMSKIRIAVLVLIVATIIYAVALALSVQAYNTWKQTEIERYYKEHGDFPWENWLDFKPYWQSSFCRYMLPYGGSIAFAWFLLASLRKPPKKILVFLVISIVAFVGFHQTVNVFAVDSLYVNVLVTTDEEMNDYAIWHFMLSLKLADGTYRALKIFFTYYHCNWVSDDSEHDSFELLDDAMSQLDWYWNKSYEAVNYQTGEIEEANMQLLVVVTRNGMNKLGLTLPWFRALIIEARIDSQDQVTIAHEFGHQFGLYHCSNYCVMNPDAWPATSYYCGSCIDKIIANRELLVQPLLSVIHGYGYGSVDLSPAGEYRFTVSALDMGCYSYNYGEVVTATATPSPYFEFDCWWLDGVKKWSNPITFTMNPDHILIADFYYIPGPGGGGGTCPTLFVWNGTAYVEEGLLDIHAYSDVTVHHEIENTLVLENNVYNLQLWELDNFTSHIDQVKLYAVDYEGEWHLCPLTYAYHNELGKVKHTLRFDDDNRVDLKPTETIDLKFALSTPYGETACFILEINGYNPKNPTPR